MILKLLRIFTIILSFFFLTGFVSVFSILGPSVTAFTSGNIFKAGAQFMINQRIEKQTGKTSLALIKDEINKTLIKEKKIKDFGIGLKNTHFEFHNSFCIIPNALVLSYALAVVTSGSAKTIFLAGFDGYPQGDSRNDEVNELLYKFKKSYPNAKVISIEAPGCKILPIRESLT